MDIETNYTPITNTSDNESFNNPPTGEMDDNWNSLTGLDKPEDNATDGATAGDNLKDSDDAVLEPDDVKNIESYEAGEDIDQHDVVCIKTIPETTSIEIVKDSTVWSAHADTNYGTSIQLLAGSHDAGSSAFFIEILTVGAPITEKIIKVELMVYLSSLTTTGGTNRLDLWSPDASWAENTVTWNNKPAQDDDFESSWFTVGEKTIATADVGTYIVFDITNVFKYWLEGDKNNYGIYIDGNFTAAERAIFTSSNASSNKPLLRMTETNDGDGKAYKASSNDYNKCRTLLGFARETKTTGNDVKIQKFGKIDLGETIYGRRLYLTSSGNYTTNNVSSAADRAVFLGKQTGGTNETEITLQENNILVEKMEILDGGYTIAFGTTNFYPQGDAVVAVFRVRFSGSAKSGYGEYSVRKGSDNNVCKIVIDSTYEITITWHSTNGISFARKAGSETLIIDSLTFYN